MKFLGRNSERENISFDFAQAVWLACLLQGTAWFFGTVL